MKSLSLSGSWSDKTLFVKHPRRNQLVRGNTRIFIASQWGTHLLDSFLSISCFVSQFDYRTLFSISHLYSYFTKLEFGMNIAYISLDESHPTSARALNHLMSGEMLWEYAEEIFLVSQEIRNVFHDSKEFIISDEDDLDERNKDLDSGMTSFTLGVDQWILDFGVIYRRRIPKKTLALLKRPQEPFNMDTEFLDHEYNLLRNSSLGE